MMLATQRDFQAQRMAFIQQPMICEQRRRLARIYRERRKVSHKAARLLFLRVRYALTSQLQQPQIWLH